MQTLTLSLDKRLSLLSPWLLLLIYVAVLSLMVALSLKKKWLTFKGAITAFVLGLIVFWLSGISGFIVFLFFFVSSSVFSKIIKTINGINSIEKKGEQRDSIQVLANGLPSVIALFLTKIPSLEIAALVAFASACAEATADTWSGVFGRMSHKDPVSIVTFTKVPKGISGGVTLLGFFGGLLASLLVALLSVGTFGFNWGLFSIVAGSGFLGSVIDSLLGAVLQVQYRSPLGFLTEKEEENGKKNERVRGIPGFDNDMVNLTSGILSASLALLLASLLL